MLKHINYKILILLINIKLILSVNLKECVNFKCFHLLTEGIIERYQLPDFVADSHIGFSYLVNTKAHIACGVKSSNNLNINFYNMNNKFKFIDVNFLDDNIFNAKIKIVTGQYKDGCLDTNKNNDRVWYNGCDKSKVFTIDSISETISYNNTIFISKGETFHKKENCNHGVNYVRMSNINKIKITCNYGYLTGC